MLVAFLLSAMQHGGDAGVTKQRLLNLCKGPVKSLCWALSKITHVPFVLHQLHVS